jgi:hypothetical protein
MSDNFDEAQTKPNIETVLDKINTLGDNLQMQLTAPQSDVGSLKSDVRLIRSDLGALRDECQLFPWGDGNSDRSYRGNDR